MKPQIRQVYHLYVDHDGSNALSLISPTDWVGGIRTEPLKIMLLCAEIMSLSGKIMSLSGKK